MPSLTDLKEAIQSPATRLDPVHLKKGHAEMIEEVYDNGQRFRGPLCFPGQFAVVFKFYAQAGIRAIRCFFGAPDAQLENRYQAIGEHLKTHASGLTVGFTYHRSGIRPLPNVKSEPILEMDWLEGTLLDQVDAISQREPSLAPREFDRLSRSWIQLVVRKESAGFAHGDLSGSNIMIRSRDRALLLVDYDAMYLPQFKGQAQSEAGHPAYQHPRARTNREFDERMDEFSNLLIYVALRALSENPSLWAKYTVHDREGRLMSENLLFTYEDLRDPNNSKLFDELNATSSAELCRGVYHLQQACTRPINQVPRFLDVAQLPTYKISALGKARKVWHLVAATGQSVRVYALARILGAGILFFILLLGLSAVWKSNRSWNGIEKSEQVSTELPPSPEGSAKLLRLESSLQMDVGVMALPPNQYHGAVLPLDLSSHEGNALHVEAKTGNHRLAIQLWEGQLSPDEHAWWVNHAQVASHGQQTWNPSLNWQIKPGLYTLLFFHDPVADRCDTRDFTINYKVTVDSDLSKQPLLASGGTVQESFVNTYATSIWEPSGPGPPTEVFRHIRGTTQIIHVVIERYGVPIHEKPIQMQLFHNGEVIFESQGMIELDNQGTSFPVQADFAPGQYLARLTVGDEPVHEVSFVVEEWPLLRVGVFTTCESVSRTGTYTPKDEFVSGEPVCAYAEILNANRDSTLDIELDFRIADPDGVVLSRPRRISRVTSEQSVAAWENFTLPPDSPPGTYVASLHVQDNLTGQLTDKTISFRVKITYSGPKVGIILWSGEIRSPNDLIVIEKGRSNIGVVQGSLPGVQCQIEKVSRTRPIAIVEPPMPANNWSRVVVRIDGKGRQGFSLRWTVLNNSR